ncbi:MAG: Maf family protein [Candidatus Poseidoniia archaeon]
MQVWLASASERRAQLLKEFGFQVKAEALHEHQEIRKCGFTVSQMVKSICTSKVDSAIKEWSSTFDGIAIVADTLVQDPDDAHLALGQPEDEYSAVAVLSRLSGRRHAVWSATALISKTIIEGDGEELLISPGWYAKIWLERALVEIEDLGAHALDDLVSSGSWRGKAGGYDMAGAISEYSQLVDGNEMVVLGLATGAIQTLYEITGVNPSE